MDAIGNGSLSQYSAFCVVWLYNRIRRHSGLGYLSPENFEQAFYQRAEACRQPPLRRNVKGHASCYCPSHRLAAAEWQVRAEALHVLSATKHRNEKSAISDQNCDKNQMSMIWKRSLTIDLTLY
jgi:hypothetical protein